MRPMTVKFRRAHCCLPGLLTAILLLLNACAPAPGLNPSPALQQQLDQLRQQQQDQAAELQALREQLKELQQPLSEPETAAATTPADELSPPEAVPPVVASPSPAEPAAPVASGEMPLAEFTTTREVADLAASASSYLTAFSSLAAGQWPAAERGFADFLETFPDHRYAPNARYWLATAQLAQDKTEAAMSSLRRIIVDPRGSARAPAALAQLARLYRQQGLQMQAEDVIEQLQRRFPDSPEAQRL